MDISHHKLKSHTWEPYNLAIEDYDLIKWSNNYSLIHDDLHNKPSQYPSISSTQLLQVDPILLGLEQEQELGAMKEMKFKIAAMQPVDNFDPATIRKPKRRNVRISDDPQSVAARHRRERISEKIGILQRLVPGGTKMDTASMLEEAVRYVKFLKRQITLLQALDHHHQPPPFAIAPIEDWIPAVTSHPAPYMFEGNNISDGANHDDPMCFNNKFIGHY